MKRFWLGVGLLLVLLIGGLTLSGSLNRRYQPLMQTLTRAAEAARESDMTLSGDLLEQARRAWNRDRNFAAAVMDHNPMEQIESHFAAAENFCKAGDEEETAAACGQLAALIRALAESHQLSWWNLL